MALKRKWSARTEKLSGTAAKDLARWTHTRQKWQNDAWAFYDTLSEVESAANWIGHALSLMDLEPMTVNGKGEPVPDDKAKPVLDELGDICEMLEKWGMASVVAGEAVLVETVNGPRLYSEHEVLQHNKRLVISPARDAVIEAETITSMWRLYIPHPAKGAFAESPMRALNRDCSTLLLLKKNVDSRLSNRIMLNGMMFFAQSVSMPMQTGGVPAKPDQFFNNLRNHMRQNMRRTEQAPDVSPVLFRVATQTLQADVFKYWEPPASLTDQELQLRTEARNNFREAFDLPVEMQTSMGDLNHWGSWAVTDMARRFQLGPRAATLAAALSAGWYQEALQRAGLFVSSQAQWLKASDGYLDQQAESVADAQKAWDRGVVSDEYLRARSRIDDEFAPTSDEYIRRFGFTHNNAYLALWDLPEHEEVDWTLALSKSGGRPGLETGEPSNDPTKDGDPNDPESEVQDPNP